MADNSILFRPLQVGAIELPNRVLMAPLTRSRAHGDGTPKPMAVAYYRQRASAGLIISEATQISPMGKGYIDTPGIHSDAHVEGWKPIVEAVHAAGGRIFCQLWHVGRISHTSLLPDGAQPVSASAVRANVKTFTAQGLSDTSEPVALDEDGIAATLDDYAAAARYAKLAGFDGVEVHPLMAISSTNSCRTAPIAEATIMAARSKIDCACWARRWIGSVPCSRQIGWASGCRRSARRTTSVTAIPKPSSPLPTAC
jgi:2,4-dienoyl-CoA reductase-like NADH-dependent reductase (Old Yellow Enzyme family)